MKSNLSTAFLPFLLWGVVTLAYALRQPIQASGWPIDPYFGLLFAFPALLLVAGQISFAEMGLKIGKPLMGLCFLLLLPSILFLRFSLMGLPFHLAENATLLVVGSIAEEFFFRGYLQSQFEKSFQSTGISFFITNLLFALVHLVKGYSLVSTAMTGLIGLYFSFTKDKSGGDSLLYSAGSHSLYNLVITSVPRVGRLF